MAASVKCRVCGKHLRLPVWTPGEFMRCSQCQTIIRLPAEPPPEAVLEICALCGRNVSQEPDKVQDIAGKPYHRRCYQEERERRQAWATERRRPFAEPPPDAEEAEPANAQSIEPEPQLPPGLPAAPLWLETPPPVRAASAAIMTRGVYRASYSSVHVPGWLATLIGAGLAVPAIALVCMLVFALNQRSDTTLAVQPVVVPTADESIGPATASNEVATESGAVAPAEPVEEPSAPAPTSTPDEPAVPVAVAEPAPPMPAANPWADVERTLQPAAWLLQVEHPTNTRRWPFGTATAIGGKTLLTAAGVAIELEKFRQQQFKIYAVRPAEGERAERSIEVTESRVYVGFERTRDNPAQAPYFDLALLTASESFEETATLAASAELTALELGLPIAWYGFGHDGSAITKFPSYASQLVEGRVFLMTSLDPKSPGSPRGLHFKAALPNNGFGAPVVNGAGHIVAVYSSSTDPGAYQGLTVHSATVIVPTLIQPWLEGRDERHWVRPRLPPPAPPAPAPAKS